MKKALVITGPTATGKTDLALLLAKKFNGELVACDSRQVYIGLDIGTGKASNDYKQIKKGEGYWEIDGVKVWMYDVVDFRKQYSVANYVRDARKILENVLSRERLPIVVGGTGFYLKALFEGVESLNVPIDKDLRYKLEKFTLLELQEELIKLDGEVWRALNESDRQNPRRLIRKIEIILLKSYKNKKSQEQIEVYDFDLLKVGLTAPREVLYQKVDGRVVSRVSEGMIEEARRLKAEGMSFKRMQNFGLEYGVLADFLSGVIKTQEEMIIVLQNKIHGYIRRQLTWFKREKDINWFDITKKGYEREIEKKVAKWYD